MQSKCLPQVLLVSSSLFAFRSFSFSSLSLFLFLIIIPIEPNNDIIVM